MQALPMWWGWLRPSNARLLGDGNASPVNVPAGRRAIWFHFGRRTQLMNARADLQQTPR